MRSTALIRSAPVALCLALALAGCKGREAGLDELTTGSTGAPSLRDLAATGDKWERDPGNAKLGLAYASGLQAIGQQDKRLSVLKTVAERNPNDPRLMTLYGKALVETGRGSEAEAILAASAARDPSDWKAMSALGSSYDQQGRYEEARTQYQNALKASPGNASVLNNLGMSHALSGDLPQAEKFLRQADASPGGEKQPRIRQNLSLVVGLQGRFDEAKDIAGRDLPPEQAEANMAFLQKMLAQPNTWQQLKNG